MESTLKQRGIPMNSPAWNAAMNQLSDSTARRGWEATGKATDAYNDIFNRGLKGNEQANARRKQQLEEGITTRELPSLKHWQLCVAVATCLIRSSKATSRLASTVRPIT